jgi:hypothetical protein
MIIYPEHLQDPAVRQLAGVSDCSIFVFLCGSDLASPIDLYALPELVHPVLRFESATRRIREMLGIP